MTIFIFLLLSIESVHELNTLTKYLFSTLPCIKINKPCTIYFKISNVMLIKLHEHNEPI